MIIDDIDTDPDDEHDFEKMIEELEWLYGDEPLPWQRAIDEFDPIFMKCERREDE